MKNYLIKLELIIGEYEKGNVKLVSFDTVEEAKEHALRMECHGEPEFIEDGDACWDMGEMIYRVQSVVEITEPAELATLRKYL